MNLLYTPSREMPSPHKVWVIVSPYKTSKHSVCSDLISLYYTGFADLISQGNTTKIT